MPIYHKVADPATAVPSERVRLDERFVSLLLPEDAQERLEAQELRQLVHHALKELSADELQVVESRYQYKKSPGQVAARMGIGKGELRRLEQSALAKLRRALEAWHREG